MTNDTRGTGRLPVLVMLALAFVLAVGGAYDVGVARNAEGTLDVVCDWEMARIDQSSFVGRLSQEYSAVQVRERARAAGYVIARETRESNGQIKLLLRRFQ